MRASRGFPKCQYCGSVSERVTGEQVYGHRPDLRAKIFFLCKPCDAYVGCHPGTEIPLGVLANSELRKAKVAAHLAFDRMWKEGYITRSKAYIVLAKMLNQAPKSTHIGMMSIQQCQSVVEICADLEPFTDADYKAALAWAKEHHPLQKKAKPRAEKV